MRGGDEFGRDLVVREVFWRACCFLRGNRWWWWSTRCCFFCFLSRGSTGLDAYMIVDACLLAILFFVLYIKYHEWKKVKTAIFSYRSCIDATMLLVSSWWCTSIHVYAGVHYDAHGVYCAQHDVWYIMPTQPGLRWRILFCASNKYSGYIFIFRNNDRSLSHDGGLYDVRFSLLLLLLESLLLYTCLLLHWVPCVDEGFWKMGTNVSWGNTGGENDEKKSSKSREMVPNQRRPQRHLSRTWRSKPTD